MKPRHLGRPALAAFRTTPEKLGIRTAESKFEPLSTLPLDVPDSYRGRWERLASRAATSYRAAVELKCLECSSWERTEAKRCEIAGCPLWALSGRIFGRGGSST